MSIFGVCFFIELSSSFFLGGCDNILECQEGAENDKENPLYGSVFVNIVGERGKEKCSRIYREDNGNVSVRVGESKKTSKFFSEECEVSDKKKQAKPSAFDEKFHKVVVSVGASELNAAKLLCVEAECVRSHAKVLPSVYTKFCSNVAPYTLSPCNGTVGVCLKTSQESILHGGK